MLSTVFGSVLRTAAAVIQVVLLLVVELISAMLVYIYLNLYHLPIFGTLVRFSKYVLDTLIAQMEYWVPISANAAYATLIGELGPKSILLLLIGLVCGVVVRFLARLVARLARRKTPAAPVGETA